MQVKKSEMRLRIMKVARVEFASQGFQRTTMRSIAKKAAITTSNIYNYYKNKDRLFEEIVKPTLSKIMITMEEMEQMDIVKDIDILGDLSLKKQFDVVIHFIDTHRQDLNLIFFKSHGSNIQNLKENFINRYTEIFIKQLQLKKKDRPEINTEISRFFVHNLCSLYANIIVEIIMHDISFDKMKEYSKEFFTFVSHGVKALIGLKDGI